jgi:phospholipid-translocating ATPase
MSVPHHYHQPNAPDQSDDDSASDLDLDVEELAPSLSPRAQHSPTRRAANFDYSRRIPLRAIRARNRDAYDAADGEDTQALLEDGLDAKFDSDESGLGRGPDAPLLRSPSGSQAVGNALSRLGSLLPASSRRGPGDAEEPENEHDPAANRVVSVGLRQASRFPINAISNSRYTPWSFLPVTLFNEFKFFINMYFLMVALSQIIPALRIGYLFSYILPLSLVLTVTLGKEAWDDITRRRRDAEANSEPFTMLRFDGEAKSGSKKRSRKPASDHLQYPSLSNELDRPKLFREVTRPSRDIKVGDVVKLKKNQRVPADIIILQCKAHESHAQAQSDPSLTRTESNDTASQTTSKSSDSADTFIRTDQLDGETDWKLRLASPLSQSLDISDFTKLKVVAGKPDRKVNEFVGTLQFVPGDPSSSTTETSVPLTVDNTAWANTVIASSSTVYGVVVYTGSQTRQAMSTSSSRPKVGLLEMEINNMTKILCCISLSLSLLLVVLGRIEHQVVRPWYITTLRFLILFSTVIPISLRVNLDMGKVVYAWYIEHDKSIPDTVVRTSTIPEDLGRIEYLLSDKTGTLTQNEMDLKKVHVGTVSYANEAMDEVSAFVNQAFGGSASESSSASTLITPSSTFHVPAASATRMRREIGTRVRDLVLALAICHNVTPSTEELEDGHEVTTYQASSPDEIAIVQWTEAMGLKLLQRDRTGMVLQSSKTEQIVVRVRILNIFPFTSEGKRMGIVVKFSTSESEGGHVEDDSEIWFYQKGADTVMSGIVLPSDWLDEETSNMAREGLRTLVVGRKRISPAQYREFSDKYAQAALSLHARDAALGEVVKAYLERDLELLGITGVEDKLQNDVKGSLELLRNAGIKIWMLTGDKVETARCVAVSSKLVARGQHIHTIAKSMATPNIYAR